MTTGHELLWVSPRESHGMNREVRTYSSIVARSSTHEYQHVSSTHLKDITRCFLLEMMNGDTRDTKTFKVLKGTLQTLSAVDSHTPENFVCVFAQLDAW